MPRPFCAAGPSPAEHGCDLPARTRTKTRRRGFGFLLIGAILSAPAACRHAIEDRRRRIGDLPLPIIWLIVVGAAAGFLATRLMNIEASIPATILIGIAGALIGGLILRVLLVLSGALAGFVGAVLGALVLIWVWQALFRR